MTEKLPEEKTPNDIKLRSSELYRFILTQQINTEQPFFYATFGVYNVRKAYRAVEDFLKYAEQDLSAHVIPDYESDAVGVILPGTRESLQKPMGDLTDHLNDKDWLNKGVHSIEYKCRPNIPAEDQAILLHEDMGLAAYSKGARNSKEFQNYHNGIFGIFAKTRRNHMAVAETKIFQLPDKEETPTQLIME